MAEPEDPRDHERENESGHPPRVKLVEIGPAWQFLELTALRQVVGEQRHRDTEDGVAERFQPAHFKMVGVELVHGSDAPNWPARKRNIADWTRLNSVTLRSQGSRPGDGRAFALGRRIEGTLTAAGSAFAPASDAWPDDMAGAALTA